MPGDLYQTIKNKQAELIRKSLDGSVFAASIDAGVPAALTDPTTSLLLPLPTTPLAAMPWADLGFLSNDGAQYSRDVSTSDVTSWGSFSPTRSDITSDTETLAVLMQETKLMTIGLYTGADIQADDPATGGELIFDKPERPSAKEYRVLSIAVDETDDGEIYIGKCLPRAKVTNFEAQSFGGGDDPIGYGVTFTGRYDKAVGCSARTYFGGPGWTALLEKMGFEPQA